MFGLVTLLEDFGFWDSAKAAMLQEVVFTEKNALLAEKGPREGWILRKRLRPTRYRTRHFIVNSGSPDQTTVYP
ncbi:MAG: hypothetical protein GY924_06315 [Planctomycetaceae bacterium]|nr:hypothetical protein [Planctomycetaceae bacterium]